MWGSGAACKGYEELSEVMEMFDLLIEVMVTRAYICQNSSNCRLEMSAFSGRYISHLNFKRRAILGRSKISKTLRKFMKQPADQHFPRAPSAIHISLPEEQV